MTCVNINVGGRTIVDIGIGWDLALSRDLSASQERAVDHRSFNERFPS